MLLGAKLLPPEVVQFLRYSALAGFLAATTLLINLNNKAFNTVFKERAKSYFWFFLILSVIPLLAIIYIFNVLFGKLLV